MSESNTIIFILEDLGVLSLAAFSLVVCRENRWTSCASPAGYNDTFERKPRRHGKLLETLVVIIDHNVYLAARRRRPCHRLDRVKMAVSVSIFLSPANLM